MGGCPRGLMGSSGHRDSHGEMPGSVRRHRENWGGQETPLWSPWERRDVEYISTVRICHLGSLQWPLGLKGYLWLSGPGVIWAGGQSPGFERLIKLAVGVWALDQLV